METAPAVDTGQSNFTTILCCRFCATLKHELIGIYTEEGIKLDLSNKINLYMPVKVSIEDTLPLECCLNCANTLQAWHELVVTSVETDKKFRCTAIICEEENCSENVDFEVTGDLKEDCNIDEIEMLESKSLHKSLHDFSESKSKLEPHFECVPLQEPTSILCNTYIDEIEQHLIETEFVDSNTGYKLDPLSDGEKCTAEAGEEQCSYLSCPHCDAFFLTKKNFLAHVKDDHGTEVKKEKRKHNKIDQKLIEEAKVVVEGRIYYNCKECGKNLHSPYTYAWHTRIHTGERPFVCDLCGKQFRVSQGLIRHLRETHEGIKKFPCDLCGRMFATRRNVEEHRRIHTNERPYVCDLCGKAFKQKASLFVHKRSHKNFFPYKCSYCSLGFRTKPTLMTHITRHTGEKPYTCDVCARGFRIKYELKRHRLIHSDEKPWVCKTCGFSFRQKRYLRNHEKSNHASNDNE